MSISFKMETRELQQAMRFYAFATKKDEADVVNHAALNVLISKTGTVKNTKKAIPDEITASLRNDRIALKMASAKLAGSGSGKKGAWQKKVGAAARRTINRRRSATAYGVSGWVNATKDLNPKARGPKKTFRKKTGRGRSATQRSAIAIVENFATNIDKVPGAEAVFRRAITGTARDMVQYATNKLRKTARMYSAK